MELVDALWRPPAPVRALTVTAIHLAAEDEAYEQEDLFAAPAPRREKAGAAGGRHGPDSGQYGSGSITFGAAAPEKEEDPLP